MRAMDKRLKSPGAEHCPEYGKIAAILGEIIASSNLDRIFKQVIRLALATCGGQEASLMLRNPATGKLEIAAQRGKAARVLKEAQGKTKNVIATWVMKHREPLLLKGNLRGTDFESYAKRRRIVASLCIPLVRGKRAIGTLSLNCTDPSAPFARDFFGKAQLLATASAAAIDHATLQMKLKRQYHELKMHHHNVLRYQNQAVMSERLTSLGIMAASVAHELKSPVTTIMSYAELLGNPELPGPRRARAVHAIAHEAERMSNIFGQLLNFSRQGESQPEPTDVNDLIHNTLVFTEHHLSRFARITVSLDLAEGLPRVLADHGQVQQVFVNMILNAAQAMGQGQLRISSRIGTGKELKRGAPGGGGESTRGPYVCVIFRDNGPGINPRQVGKIFKPFYTTKKKGEGTGLGLFICKNIIEKFGGFIQVDPNPGKGAAFSIFLPAMAAPEDQPRGMVP